MQTYPDNYRENNMKNRIPSFYNLLFIAALLGCLVAPAQAMDIESVLKTAYDKYRNRTWRRVPMPTTYRHWPRSTRICSVSCW
jgi:hypothetical protein